MAPANPVPFESTPDPAPIPSAGIQAGDAPPEALGSDGPQLVSQEELNAWRRGITPQAEIWNGRLAMVGLSVGLTVLLLARLATHSN
jgi:hypothetical protein